jgi:hypothetical protein
MGPLIFFYLFYKYIFTTALVIFHMRFNSILSREWYEHIYHEHLRGDAIFNIVHIVYVVMYNGMY